MEKMEWQSIESAPRDGRELLMTDGDKIRVCYPKLFPRHVNAGGDHTESRAGDVWEYFRDDRHAPGHTWSMVPIGWMPPPPLPKEKP